VHRVPSRVYQPINVVAAAAWASAIGVAGYLVGPPVIDIFADIGPLVSALVVIVVVALVGLEIIRRRHRA
ncbi:MAG: hypothetical protein ACRDNS_21340, partial [Trebonia sp.]